MPSYRSNQSKPTSKDLPWHGRFYALRVLFTAMVLAMLATSDAICRDQPGAHVWLLLAGATYPHLSHLVFGRFEGRRRRGRSIFVIDGLFSGAVIAAIGLISAPSAVLVAINLFNWMTIGGPILVAAGATAVVAGIAFSAPNLAPAAGVCGATDVMAGVVLIAYFGVVAGFIHSHTIDLRNQQIAAQSATDAAINGHRLADSALMATLPASAAQVLTETGSLPATTLNAATLLLVEFAWKGTAPPSVTDIADGFQVCDTIMGRHGIEEVKTFGRRYLAMSSATTGPDDAVAAARELHSHILDHGALSGPAAALCSIRVSLHCGSVTGALVQPDRMNYDLVGDAVESLLALAAQSTDQPDGTVIASPAAYRRLGDAAGFGAASASPDSPCFVLSLGPTQ